MVVWNGVNFTADGREPVTPEDFHRIGQYCWDNAQYRPATAYFLEQAAVGGHAVAAELLGHVCYSQGDYAKAVPWLLRSSSRRAAYYLGRLHEDGCPAAGIVRSLGAAAEWYRRAAALGEPEAMLALGEMYLERLLPLRRSPAEHALEHFLPAAEAGHPYAQFRAADLYRTLYEDLPRAAFHYERCLANPARERHALATLMTLQSEAALRDIDYTLKMRAQQQHRDAVNPPHLDEPRY